MSAVDDYVAELRARADRLANMGRIASSAWYRREADKISRDPTHAETTRAILGARRGPVPPARSPVSTDTLPTALVAVLLESQTAAELARTIGEVTGCLAVVAPDEDVLGTVAAEAARVVEVMTEGGHA